MPNMKKILLNDRIRMVGNITGLLVSSLILTKERILMYGHWQTIYVSVVPVQFDLTHYKLKKQLEKDWNIFSNEG